MKQTEEKGKGGRKRTHLVKVYLNDAEYEKKWAENPPPPREPIIDTEREKIPVHYNVPASAFDFEEKEGHTAST